MQDVEAIAAFAGPVRCALYDNIAAAGREVHHGLTGPSRSNMADASAGVASAVITRAATGEQIRASRVPDFKLSMGVAMTLRQSLVDVGFKTMSLTHRAIVHLSGTRLLGSAFGMPAVELHTVGRKSGRRRSTMLSVPIIDGDRLVLVASKGGDDRDPDWYHNLTADPQIEITIAGERRPMRARRSSAEEKSELWPRVVAAHRGYNGYQRRTKRDIPLVICEPR